MIYRGRCKEHTFTECLYSTYTGVSVVRFVDALTEVTTRALTFGPDGSGPNEDATPACYGVTDSPYAS